MKSIKFIFCVSLLLLLPESRVISQNPIVDNVRIVQHNNSNVEVYYDLVAKVTKKYTVDLFLYHPGKNIKKQLAGSKVSGDVGKNISPGTGKKIIFYIPKEFTGSLKKNGFKFIVDATLQKKRKKWPWIVAGISAVGGAALLLISSSSSSSTSPNNQDLAEPPEFP